MSAQANAALAQKIYQLWSNNKFDEVLALTAEDVEVTLVPFGQTFYGHEGFLAFMKSFKTAFPDITITQVIKQIATDEAVVSEFKAQGTHTGPLMTPAGEVPPTGQEVNLTVCEVWEIRNGKLAAFRNYQDAATMMRQLGLLPEPAAAG
jgi:steroid delta-isomerase-like uncharacterized protein